MKQRNRFSAASAAVAAVLVILFVILSYRNPPLRITGGVTGISGKARDEVVVGWDLSNNGWFPARITEVTVEGYEGMNPIWLMGAVGTHGQMVGSSMDRIPQQDGYWLQPLGHFTVPPSRALPAWENAAQHARTFKAPSLYGLVALYRFQEEGKYAVAERITIRYRYLGLPMRLIHSW